MNASTTRIEQTPRTLLVLALGLLTFWGSGRAYGFINPKFTPVELIKESQCVCVAVLERPDPAGNWRCASITDIKGKTPSFQLDPASAKPAELNGIQALLDANKSSPVLLFSAKTDAGWKGYFHVGGEWISASARADGRWLVESRAPQLSGAWAGGTDMLIRQVRHLAAHPEDRVPVSVGMTLLETQAELGRLDDRPAGLVTVELPGLGLCLFVALPAGDRLFRAKPNDEAFEEITASTKLTTRSRCFAWTDLDGDGRLELASWDGTQVSLWRLAQAGTFERADGGKGFPYAGRCLGLSACARHREGAPSLVLSGTTDACLLRYSGSKWESESLLRDSPTPANAPCIVADLDGDGWWDLLQLGRQSSLLFRGGAGGLSKPAPCNLAVDGETCRWTLGDFNQDGFLDVFVVGEKGNALWENNGKGEFRDVTHAAGSLSYKSPPGVADCLATDLNHDGRTDLCLCYSKSMLLYHFNRGFRCFGEEGELRLSQGEAGQWGAAVADFNGDGSLDLVVALADGRLRCYYNRAFEQPMLRVSLKPKVPAPVTVSVWPSSDSDVSRGMFLVPPSPGWALVALRDKGPVLLKWHVPGGARQKLVPLPASIPISGVEVVLDP
jgi:hypothetical protein